MHKVKKKSFSLSNSESLTHVIGTTFSFNIDWTVTTSCTQSLQEKTKDKVPAFIVITADKELLGFES